MAQGGTRCRPLRGGRDSWVGTGPGSLEPERLAETTADIPRHCWNADCGNTAKVTLRSKMTLRSKLVHVCVCHKAEKSEVHMLVGVGSHSSGLFCLITLSVPKTPKVSSEPEPSPC